MLPHVIVKPDPLVFNGGQEIEVAIQVIAKDSDTLATLGIKLVRYKKKTYAMLTKIEGPVEQFARFAETMVAVIKRCIAGWECWAVEKDRFAIDPEIYDILPHSVLDFVEIDDELLFFSSKGVAHFSDTVPLYKIEMT